MDLFDTYRSKSFGVFLCVMYTRKRKLVKFVWIEIVVHNNRALSAFVRVYKICVFIRFEYEKKPKKCVKIWQWFFFFWHRPENKYKNGFYFFVPSQGTRPFLLQCCFSVDEIWRWSVCFDISIFYFFSVQSSDTTCGLLRMTIKRVLIERDIIFRLFTDAT